MKNLSGKRKLKLKCKNKHINLLCTSNLIEYTEHVHFAYNTKFIISKPKSSVAFVKQFRVLKYFSIIFQFKSRIYSLYIYTHKIYLISFVFRIKNFNQN